MATHRAFDPAKVVRRLGKNNFDDKLVNWRRNADLDKSMALYLTALHEGRQWLGNCSSTSTIVNQSSHDLIFISLDVIKIHNKKSSFHGKISEVGFSVFDTRAINHTCMGPRGSNWLGPGKTKEYHLVAIDSKGERSTFKGAGSPYDHRHGSTFVDRDRLGDITLDLVREVTQGVTRNFVLLGHGLGPKIEDLATINVFIPGLRTCIGFLDTQRLVAAAEFELSWTARGPSAVKYRDLAHVRIEELVQRLEIPLHVRMWKLHNAVTNAAVIMEGLVRIIARLVEFGTQNTSLAKVLVPRSQARWNRQGVRDLPLRMMMLRRDGRAHGVNWKKGT